MFHVISSEKIGTPAANYPEASFASTDEAFAYAEENAEEFHYGLEVVDDRGDVIAAQ